MLWLLALNLAFAQGASYYLESPTVSARGELSTLLDIAEDAGWSARIIRRYELGEGWIYALVVEDFDDEGDARAAAAHLAELGGMGVAVYRREGRAGVRLSADWPAGDPEGEAVAGELPAADEILLRAVRALGGREGGGARLEEASAVRFQFEREVAVADGVIRARHDYARAGESLRLEIEILEGEAQSSLTVVSPEGAWLRTTEGVIDRDAGRAAELLAGFSPEQILSYPLRFAWLVERDPAHDALRTVARRSDLERPCLQLEDGEGLGVCVDVETWRPIEVSFSGEAGLVRYAFGDWREIDTGLVLPFELVTWRDGEVIERVKVRDLSLPAELEEGLFRVEAEG
ncbi:MAG: hypothetical protein H6740_23965 [Alphaproteobacteria bacterium]|nr:hypothetical protein [Alphaproteobacteria bacterium]